MCLNGFCISGSSHRPGCMVDTPETVIQYIFVHFLSVLCSVPLLSQQESSHQTPRRKGLSCQQDASGTRAVGLFLGNVQVANEAVNNHGNRSQANWLLQSRGKGACLMSGLGG